MYTQKNYKPNLFQTIFSVGRKNLTPRTSANKVFYASGAEVQRLCSNPIKLCAGAENLSLEIPPHKALPFYAIFCPLPHFSSTIGLDV